MLELLRKKQKSALVKLVFWVIIAAFVGTIFLVWGRGRDGAENDSSPAFTVNGVQVSFGEFQTVQRNMALFYENIYGSSATIESQLPQLAYDQLADQILLQQESERLDIRISHDEVVNSIAEIPQFQQDGVFIKGIYIDTLKRQGMTGDEFEARQERLLRAEKTQEQLRAAVSVDDSDIDTEFRTRNEKVNLAFVRVAPALFESRVKVEDAALESYFSEHQEDFRTQEKVALRYLLFEPSHYADQVTFDDSEIERYYKRHLNQYAIDEQVKASHILFRIDENASDTVRSERRKLAEKVLDQARAGEDFATLARKYSDDGSASSGGTLGYFKRGMMVKEFENAAFAMQPGDISDLVETQFGLHIIKVEGYIEADEKKLPEVYEEVKKGLRTEKSKDYAFEMAMDAYNKNRKGGSLDSAASETGLTISETGPFGRDAAIGSFGQQPDLAAAAFQLQEGQLGKPLFIGDNTLLFALKERQASTIPTLAEARGLVVDAYRQQQSKVLAAQAAAEMLAGLKEGTALKKLADKYQLKVEETGMFPKTYGKFVPRLGENQGLADAAFTLTAEMPAAPEVYEIGGMPVVASLKGREEADMSKLDDSKREELRKAVLARKQKEAVDLRLEQLRTEAEIIPSATLISLGVKIKP